MSTPENYRFPVGADVRLLTPHWQYLSVLLNTNGRTCSLSGPDALKYGLPMNTDLNTIGVGGWEVVAIWAIPGDMLRALVKRGIYDAS